MTLDFELSPLQIKQIASSIDLKDVKNYIENHKEEYEQFLKDTEEVYKVVQFTKYVILKKIPTLKILKKYNANFCTIWQEYKEQK